MEYLGTKPGNLKPDKNGNPQVPKEVHEFSIVGSWDKLDSKTKDELQDVFPSIAKTVKSKYYCLIKLYLSRRRIQGTRPKSDD
jgi:hypothetical protein